MIRYENRQFWRMVQSGASMDFPSAHPQQCVTEVLCTGPVTLRAVSLDAEGEVIGEPFLVGVAQAGHTPVKVRHGGGLALILEFAKGVEAWLYDDREDHQAVAPVGVSFTVFEQPGHIFNDPVQVLIARDENLKALRRMAQRDNPKPDKVAELEAANKRLTDRLDKLERANEPKPEAKPDDQGEPKSGTKD